MGKLTSELFKNANQNAAKDGLVTDETKKTPAWRGVRDVNQRLEACAALDAQNIKPMPKAKGPHVTMIHQALEMLAGSALKPDNPADPETRLFNAGVQAATANIIGDAEREAAEYGPQTAKAIFAYKKAKDIRRPGRPVDNVVGIMTIQALDRDLNIAKGVAPVPPPKPPVDPNVIFVDFVVRMRAGPTRPALAELAPGTVEQHGKKGNRKLVGIVKDVTGTNDSAAVTGAIADIDAELKKVENGKTRQQGIICIHGNSNGARVALNLAAALKGKRKLRFVGCADAAINADREKTNLNEPQPKESVPLRDGKAKNKPVWSGVPDLEADIKDNWFQDADNFWKRSVTGGGKIIWSGSGLINEIHGRLRGFDNDGGQEITVPPGNKPHDFAGDEGDKKNGARISQLLAELPSAEAVKALPLTGR